MLPTRARPRILVLLTAAAAVSGVGCSPGESPAPAPPPPPPPPPAACVLDTAALTATTGLSWTPDASTASDTRCVYDPAGTPRPPEGPAFVVVDVAAAADPTTALDTVAQVCEDGSRVPSGEGFVCRFPGGSVFAAVLRDDRVVTVAASGIPEGTSAARLVMAFDQQLAALAR